jgi:hypothetical protein
MFWISLGGLVGILGTAVILWTLLGPSSESRMLAASDETSRSRSGGTAISGAASPADTAVRRDTHSPSDTHGALSQGDAVVNPAPSVDAADRRGTQPSGGIPAATSQGDAVSAGPRALPADDPVVGVQECRLFAADELKQRVGTLKAGEQVSVDEERDCAVRVSTAKGKKGWVRRCCLCTAPEFDRRKKAGEIPNDPLCIALEIKGRDGNVVAYDGIMHIRNNETVLDVGQAIWTDQTTKAKTFNLRSYRLVGDPDVLFLLQGEGRVKKMQIWRKAGSDNASVENSNAASGGTLPQGDAVPNAAPLVDTADQRGTRPSGGILAATSQGDALSAAPGALPANDPLVGVQECSLFRTNRLEGQIGKLQAGTTVSVEEWWGGAVRVAIADGKKGWVQRCCLCTAPEFQRRKHAGEVPATAFSLGAGTAVGFFVYGGIPQIRNGQPVWKEAGQAFWMDQTATLMTLDLGSHIVVGDPEFLFLYTKDGRVAKLPIWTGAVNQVPSKVPATAEPLQQHIRSLRVALPETSPLLTENIIKRVHAIYDPHRVKIVVGHISESSPFKEDAILMMTYATHSNQFGTNQDFTCVWIDDRQQSLVTANATTVMYTYTIPDKLGSSMTPPLFLYDLRSCVASRQVVATYKEAGGEFTGGGLSNGAVASADGNYLIYVGTFWPSREEERLGKKERKEVCVLDTKHGKIVSRQPCLGINLFLTGSVVCCYGWGDTGLEIFDATKLPNLTPATSLFAGKKVEKVAAAGTFLCVLVEGRLHIVTSEPQPHQVSVDDALTESFSFWTGSRGQVWMVEAVSKGAKRPAGLRLGRVTAEGRTQVEGKTDLVEMGLGERIANGYPLHFALDDKWAVSVDGETGFGECALRLYDLSSGKPKLVQTVDGVAGNDIILSGDLCAVLDDSVLRFFSIADPKNIRRVGDVPLGKMAPAAVVATKDMPFIALTLHLQSANSWMHLVNDQIVAYCAGIQLTAKDEFSAVAQIHEIQLAPFRATARVAAIALLSGCQHKRDSAKHETPPAAPPPR